MKRLARDLLIGAALMIGFAIVVWLLLALVGPPCGDKPAWC